MQKTKRGKCPTCLPDSPGAIFSAYGSEEWQCNNCGHILKRRKRKAPSGKPTASQARMIERLKRFGGEQEVKFIGRKVWISGKNYDGRNMYMGQSYFGTIGPKGAIKLKLQRIFKDVDITDMIGVQVYLDTPEKTNQ